MTAINPSVPLGFTGHEGDMDPGLVNIRGRMYDPVAGLFMSADPIMAQPFGQGLNRFAYVNNSPLNMVDPSGFTGFELDYIVHLTESAPASAPAMTSSGTASADVATAATAAGSLAGLGASIAAAAPNLPDVIKVLEGAPIHTKTSTPVTGNTRSPGASNRGPPKKAHTPNNAAAPATEKAPGCNQEWGCAPDVSNTAGPNGHAPVQNKTMADDAFKGDPDAAEFWDEALIQTVGAVAPGPRIAAGAGRLLGAIGKRAAVRGAVASATRAAARISKSMKCFGMCKQFANKLQSALQKKGISGTRIQIDVRKHGQIISDTVGPLAGPGSPHVAIRVGDTVFDNLRSGGIPYQKFLDDIGVPDAVRLGAARLTETAF